MTSLDKLKEEWEATHNTKIGPYMERHGRCRPMIDFAELGRQIVRSKPHLYVRDGRWYCWDARSAKWGWSYDFTQAYYNCLNNRREAFMSIKHNGGGLYSVDVEQIA